MAGLRSRLRAADLPGLRAGASAMPSMNGGTWTTYATVHDDDAHNYEQYIMHANITRFDGARLRIDYVIGTLAELRELRREGDSPYFCFVVELLRSPEDIDFFARWRAAHGQDWPHTPDSCLPHHALRGAYRVHWRYERAWYAARERERTSVMRYNAAHLEI